MSRSIRDELDQVSAVSNGGIRPEFIEDAADCGNDVNVGSLAVSAYVVGFAWLAIPQHGANCLTVISHIEPVAHILAVAVNGKWLALERIQNHQRNQLFGKLQRAVVVG